MTARQETIRTVRWLCGTLTAIYVGIWTGSVLSRFPEPVIPFVLLIGGIVLLAAWVLYWFERTRVDAMALPPDYQRAAPDDETAERPGEGGR